MQISEHIARLLYQNDCVVVPAFGGFVTSYTAAKVHPINHAFYPPSKSILFNPKLTGDDGLLIHNISVVENISYSEAKAKIDQFVAEAESILESQGKLSLELIGIIKKDVEGNLLFDPDLSTNYLEESFGLPVFTSRPIIRESIHRRLEKKFIDRKPVPERDRKTKKVYWVYAILLPVLIMVGWLIFNNGIYIENTQQTGVIPELDSESISLDAKDIEEQNTKPVTPLKDLNFEDPGPESKTDLEESFPEEIQLEIKPQTPKYYIIGGAFRFRDNADGLIATLREKGYDAQPAGQNRDGLHMVCYFSSEDKSEALVNLAMIRKDNNPSAWLLKK